jgi:hypothetical protein
MEDDISFASKRCYEKKKFFVPLWRGQETTTYNFSASRTKFSFQNQNQQLSEWLKSKSIWKVD